jgi:hypothetical protein
VRQLDFMIVGVQKAGTTALANFLSEHPDIAIASGKEVHLFDSPEYVPSWSREQIDAVYAPRFEGQSEKRLLGEATPIYTYFQDIPECLAAYNSKLKLIMLLRDPADRAISQYWMERGRKDEFQPLWVALLLESFRLLWDFFNQTKRGQGSNSRVHSYVSRGHYTAQINNLLNHFPASQLLVVDSDALLSNHNETMRSILLFLGATIEHIPTQKRVFAGDYPAKANGLVRLCLDLYFGLERRRLRKLLSTLNQIGEWRWLGDVQRHNSS